MYHDSKPRDKLDACTARFIFLMRPDLDQTHHNKFSCSGDLARQFGVSVKAIRDIWNARTWANATKDLDPERRPRATKSGVSSSKPRASKPSHKTGAELDAAIHQWHDISIPNEMQQETVEFMTIYDNHPWSFQ